MIKRIMNNCIPIKKIIITSCSNFTYEEMIKSNIAVRYGIKNIPSEQEWKCLELLVQNVLQPVRDHFGPIKVSSGYRSKELCLKIGSSAHSNHIRGQAADIEPLDSNITLFELLKWIHDNCEYRELIAEYFPHGWVHVAYREGANNKQIKLKDINHNYYECDFNYIKKIYG